MTSKNFLYKSRTTEYSTTALQPMISIIIVTYNCQDLVLTCLESLHRSKINLNFEVIVVDNASFDDTISTINRRYPNITTIQSVTNIGFGRACNLGARSAKNEFILLLNPDTELNEDTISELLSFARQNPAAGIWGGVTVDRNGTPVTGSCWRFPTLWSTFCIVSGLTRVFPNSAVFNSEAYGGQDHTTVREVDIVSGCFLLIRATLWRSLDGFNPIYFMYAEEADLCLRARRLGARPMICPTATLIHHVGQTQDIRADRISRLLKGKITFMRLHWTSMNYAIGRTLLQAWPLSRIFVLFVAYWFSKRPDHRSSLDNWRRTWQNRKGWINGYSRD